MTRETWMRITSVLLLTSGVLTIGATALYIMESELFSLSPLLALIDIRQKEEVRQSSAFVIALLVSCSNVLGGVSMSGFQMLMPRTNPLLRSVTFSTLYIGAAASSIAFVPGLGPDIAQQCALIFAITGNIGFLSLSVLLMTDANLPQTLGALVMIATIGCNLSFVSGSSEVVGLIAALFQLSYSVALLWMSNLLWAAQSTPCVAPQALTVQPSPN